jgi:tetratricopeptide (TPR) repeat protein
MLTIYLFYSVLRLWVADTHYALGRAYNNEQRFPEARQELAFAINSYPHQADYYNELAESAAGIALLFANPEATEAETFAALADDESQQAVDLSPANVNMLRARSNTLLKVSLIDPSYLEKAKETLSKATSLAPTDAKLFYNLGLTHARLNESAESLAIMQQTVDMKPDYRNARFALALFLVQDGRQDEAIEQLVYILEYINPDDVLVQNELENLR